MNVADLQQQFRSIAQFAERAGAGKSAVADLIAVSDAFTPFGALTVAEFGRFLRTADEYARDGTLPLVPAKKAPAKRAPAKPKAAVIPPEEIIERIYRLDEMIAGTTLAEDAISAELMLVDQLKQPDLRKLAEKLNMWHANKKLKVPQLKAKIQEEVRERKNRYERSDY